jgi:hypothetical protein
MRNNNYGSGVKDDMTRGRMKFQILRQFVVFETPRNDSFEKDDKKL